MRDNNIMIFFFFNDTAPTEIYTLSLPDALPIYPAGGMARGAGDLTDPASPPRRQLARVEFRCRPPVRITPPYPRGSDRKSTRLNSSHANISYAVFCLKKKKLYSIYPILSLSFRF